MLTRAEVTARLARAHSRSLTGYHDRCGMPRMLPASLRVAEVPALPMNDLDWHSGQHIARQGKD